MRGATILLLALSSMASAETEADFGDRVRAYLLANPEVVLEAMEILAARQAEAAFAAALAPWRDALFAAPTALGIGDPNAPIRVVEFVDYKCAPCKALHPKLEALVAAEPDLRIETLHLPILSRASDRAARFALAVQAVAGDAVYARIHGQLWAARGPLNDATFAALAEAEGLDVDPILAAMDSAGVDAEIARNRDIAIALEIRGTPAFVTPRAMVYGQSDIDALSRLFRQTAP